MIRFFFLLLFSLLSVAASAQSEFTCKPGVQPALKTPLSNEIILLQSGQLNQIQLQDKGAGNQINLQQQGINNVLDLDISGNDNQYSFSQQGDNNLAQWHSRQQNHRQLEVLQRGDNNRLIQDGGSLPGGIPMRIEQTGGMQLIIKNNF
ncbi:hypothetical protein GCM10023187_18770 [Nibrella viscosa]|uniref:Curlin associated repeat-containing protein n=1 Tax=Nibrella viscosa TaxID=1084524 RepID=A0ABP8KAT6_9BACT